MKRRDLLGATTLGALLSFPALAHRLNVFAWAEGDKIHVEAKFSNGRPAKGARVSLLRGKTECRRTTTDANGHATFLPDSQEKLSVRVDAGEGHSGQMPLLASPSDDPTSENASRIVLTRGQYEELLASAKPKSIGLVEVVGGMGWIVGLAGLLSYWRAKRK